MSRRRQSAIQKTKDFPNLCSPEQARWPSTRSVTACVHSIGIVSEQLIVRQRKLCCYRIIALMKLPNSIMVSAYDRSLFHLITKDGKSFIFFQSSPFMHELKRLVIQTERQHCVMWQPHWISIGWIRQQQDLPLKFKFFTINLQRRRQRL